VLRVVRGNVVTEEVDAIVNAANEDLQHGGGVAGAIRSAGGPEIQRESDQIGRVPTGSCASTSAGLLPCDHVIHAVGPVYQGRGDEDELLASATRCALEKAEELGVKSLSMPAISSGIFGFPKGRCAEILLREADAFLSRDPAPGLREVRMCNIDQETSEIFRQALGDQSS
jgi:O-acetyl-ADP-ribose deacetylase (regulator of RNase III)